MIQTIKGTLILIKTVKILYLHRDCDLCSCSSGKIRVLTGVKFYSKAKTIKKIDVLVYYKIRKPFSKD